MKTVVTTNTVDDAELAELLEPRVNPMLERSVGDGEFELEDGPFKHYRRTVEVAPAPTADGRHDVTQTVEFELNIPIWGFLFKGLVVKAIRKPPAAEEHLWWLPPDRMDSRSTEVLSLLCVFSMMAGYLGVLLSQLNPYFKDEFGSTNSDIANVLLGIRIAGIFALAVVAFADRRGRKRILMISIFAAIGFAVLGAFAPNLIMLGISQTAARTFSAAVALLVGIMSAEEMPAGARAFAVSVLVATGALGAGGVVVFLQIADMGTSTWRIFFLVPLLMVYPAIRIGRRLPESRRYEVFEVTGGRAAEHVREHETGPSTAAPIGTGFRFAVLASTAFLLNVFSVPAGGFFNEFLKTEQGYDGLKITGLQVLTNLPGGLSMIVGGRLAESRGRRVIGAIGIAGGFGFSVLMYLATGWPLWLFSTFGTLLGAMAIPALGVYGAELFPTGSRGLAGGGLNFFGVAGGALGLVIVGQLADRWGSFGPAIAVLGLAPALVVVIILTLYPETAHRELEELNPEDAAPPHGDRALADLDEEFAEVDEVHHDHEGHHPR